MRRRREHHPRQVHVQRGGLHRSKGDIRRVVHGAREGPDKAGRRALPGPGGEGGPGKDIRRREREVRDADVPGEGQERLRRQALRQGVLDGV